MKSAAGFTRRSPFGPFGPFGALGETGACVPRSAFMRSGAVQGEMPLFHAKHQRYQRGLRGWNALHVREGFEWSDKVAPQSG